MRNDTKMLFQDVAGVWTSTKRRIHVLATAVQLVKMCHFESLGIQTTISVVCKFIDT